MIRNKVIIYPKDIQIITGRSERYAQNIIAAIKKWRGKQKHQLVTYDEFCEFIGIDPDELVAHWTTHSDQ
jgi:hypothetical protein